MTLAPSSRSRPTAPSLRYTLSTAITDGCVPVARLIQGSDGDFYGTTLLGGAGGGGTVFKITRTGTLTTLHSFRFNDRLNGFNPFAPLIQGSDGNFYGTTNNDGDRGCGSVFKITAAGTFTELSSLASDGLDRGCLSFAGLIQATDGNFYGTTSSGDFDHPGGTIFKITTAGILTAVHTFNCMSEGCAPRASLIQATDGQLYGTAPQGGPGGEGVVFRFTLPPPPPNDDVDNATVIRALPFTDSIDMSLATVAADDPLPSCADPLIGNGPRTTWYSFTPDHDVQIAYDAVGSSYEPGIAVYTGSRGALTEVHCSGGFSAPVLHAKANVTYLFFIQNLNGSLVFNAREPLSALSPARIWIGLKNSDDVGLRLDLLSEVFIDSAKVGEGQLNNVRTGSSGFNNAGLHAIPLELTGGPVNIPLGSTLRLTVSARRTCFGGGHASGTARLWYNGQPIDSGAKRDAGSRFDAISGSATVHNFLRAGFERLDLDTAPGSSKRSLDVSVDSMQPCRDRTFKSFGTWSSKP